MKKIKTSILGIDPSYHSSGYCLIDFHSGKIIEYGVILHVKDVGLCKSLYDISEKIKSLIIDYNVISVAIEQLNFSSNFRTSQALLRVQGALMRVVYEIKQQEIVQFHNISWRSKLGIKRPKKEINTKNGKKEYPTIKVDNKKVKKDIKYITVVKINEMYGLNLSYSENDIADAIGICTCLYQDIKALK